MNLFSPTKTLKFPTSKRIAELEKTLELYEKMSNSFHFVKIRIASPAKIKSWAERILPSGFPIGEVILSETINFRTLIPETNGLFCQIIFGPIKSWNCKCKKYTRFSPDYIGKICENCLVEITEARVRRYRMGYVELTCPLVHFWYLKGVPNYLLTFLRSYDEELRLSHLEEIIYFKEGSDIISPQNPLFPFFCEKTETNKERLKRMLLRKSFQYSQKYNKVLFKPSSAEEVEAKDLKKRNKKSPHQIPEKREGEKKPSPFSFLQQAKVDIKLEEETEEAIEQRFFAALKKESRKTQKVLEELKQRENKDKKQSKTEIRKTDLEKYIQEPIKSENKIESTEDDLGLWNNFCTVINYNSEYEIKDASFPYRDILFLSSDDEVDFKNEGLDRRTDRMTSQSIGLEEPVIETLTRKPTSNQSATRSEFFTVAVNSGGEIIKEALRNIHLPTEILSLRNLLVESPKTNLRPSNLSDTALLRRLRIFENFWSTSTEPTWLMLTLLPVLPPSLRPLIELPTGKLVVADVNEIYKLILMRNETLFHLIHKFRCPMVVKIFNQKLLQEAVDSLIDNARVRKSRVMTVNNQPLKSLSEVLEGKQGRFRQSLLGKRVDYSGRSVIVVNPTLRLNQCGLPYEMARELFEPFLVNQLLQTRIKPLGRNTRLATLIIRKNKPFVWSLLEKLTRERCILLNRAPTLHRFGIQAFDPLIVLGQAIHLHPLVCTGFNADFDGDQMAVHLPISDISQSEAKFMMRPSYNVLSPSNGEVILKPTQDMVIGCYYLTLMISKSRKISKKWFANETEAILAFYQKKLTLHTPILVRYFLSDFIIKIENSQFYLKSLFSYSTEYQKVIIYKKFKNKQKDYYFLTNLGIIIGKSFLSKEPKEPKEPGTYELTTFFFETTPGRLIFSTNLKDLVLHTQKREENEDKINLL